MDKIAHAENKDTALQLVKNKNEYGTAKLRYQSKCLPSLTHLYHLVYEGGKKVVTRSVLNMMTALSLAV